MVTAALAAYIVLGMLSCTWILSFMNLVPYTVAASFVIAIACAYFAPAAWPRWTVAGGSAVILAALLLSTSRVGLRHEKKMICRSCRSKIEARTGQEMSFEIDGKTVVYVNAGFAKAKEQANINHQAVLDHLHESAGSERVGTFERVYMYGNLSEENLVAVDGIEFENFLYSPR